MIRSIAKSKCWKRTDGFTQMGLEWDGGISGTHGLGGMDRVMAQFLACLHTFYRNNHRLGYFAL